MAQHISIIIRPILDTAFGKGLVNIGVLKNGELDGIYYQCDDNCVTRIEERYVNGDLTNRREYDEEGRLRLQEPYNFYGRRDGIRVTYDEAGAIKSKTLFVRGFAVDGWLHKVINERAISARDILRIDSDEIRRVCVREMGYDKFLNQVECKIIAGEHQSVLLRVNLPGKKKKFSFLRAYVFECGEWYLFQAPHDAKTIQQAFAWALERVEGAWPCND